MAIESERGKQFIRNLINEYEETARYFRMMASLWQGAFDDSKGYQFTMAEYEMRKRELKEFKQDAIHFQELADRLKGDKDGRRLESEDLRSTGVSHELPNQSGKFEGITCTTVL